MAQGVDPSELEKLIHDCEFENQQIVKLIEHEDSLLENVEREVEWKKTEIRGMEEENTSMDGQVKQLHRDFVQNKENIERQKKTGQILMEQISAMNKTLDMLNEKRKNERQEHDRVLQHYQGICDRYRKIYESRPAFQQLQEAMARHAVAKKLIQDKQDNIARLKRKINFLNSKKAGKTMTQDEQSFIIKLAETRLANMKLFDEIEHKKRQVQVLKQRQQQQQQQQEQQQTRHQNFTNYQAVPQGSIQQEPMKQAYVMDSPMISVFSGRDEEEEDTDVQMEERSSPVVVPPAPDYEQPTNEQADPPQSWLANFQRLQVDQPEPAVPAPVPQPASRPAVPQPVSRPAVQSPQPPYVAYKKTLSSNSHPEETVNVHLQSSTPHKDNQRVLTSPQIRSDPSATIKRPCPPDINATRPTSSRGPAPIPAMPDNLGMRPKIPKLEIRVPTPQVFGRPSVSMGNSGSPYTSRENSVPHQASRENVGFPQTSGGQFVNVPQSYRANVFNANTSRQHSIPQIGGANTFGSQMSRANTSQIQTPQSRAPDMQYRNSRPPHLQVPQLQQVSHQGGRPISHASSSSSPSVTFQMTPGTINSSSPNATMPYQMAQAPRNSSSPNSTMPYQMPQAPRNISGPNSSMPYQMPQALRNVSSPNSSMPYQMPQAPREAASSTPTVPHQMTQAPRIPTSPLVTPGSIQHRQPNGVQQSQNSPVTNQHIPQVSIPLIPRQPPIARSQPTFSPNKHIGNVNHTSVVQHQATSFPGSTQVISPVKNSVQVGRGMPQHSQYPGVHTSASSSPRHVASPQPGVMQYAMGSTMPGPQDSQYPGVYVSAASSQRQAASPQKSQYPAVHASASSSPGQVSSPQIMQYPGVQVNASSSQGQVSPMKRNEMEPSCPERQYPAAHGEMALAASQILYQEQKEDESQMLEEASQEPSGQYEGMEGPDEGSEGSSTFKVPDVPRRRSPPTSPWAPPPKFPTFVAGVGILGSPPPQEQGSPPQGTQESQTQQDMNTVQSSDQTSGQGDDMEEEIRMKMLGPNEPYYLKLKDDSEQKQAEETNSNSESLDESTSSQADPNSPFNMEKHMRKLEELKKLSPGCPTYTARMMFSKDQMQEDGEDAMSGDANKATDPKDQSSRHVVETNDFVFCPEFGSFDGKGSASPNMFGFGGGDASDNTIGSSFSLFGNSDDKDDKTDTNFSLFGNVDADDKSAGEFSLFGAPADKGASSPPSALSLFGPRGGGNDEEEDQGNFQFCPVFSSPVNSPEQKSFSLF